MKTKGIHYLFAFLSFMVVTGLGCSAVTTTPTSVPEPTDVPATQASTDSTNTTNPTDAPSTDLVTFTDKNSLFAVDLPGDWIHTTDSGEHYYIDTFTSPDKAAVVENIAYDDGTAFSGNDNGRFALQILNKNYSNTGKDGDIRVTDDSIQSDGSERLSWTSKSGKYSGYSYFEIRNKTTFLMFTIDWGNNSKDQYIDTLDKVVSSYRRVP
jgi:hypothetical protein